MLESDSASFTRSDEGYFLKTEMRAVRQDFENEKYDAVDSFVYGAYFAATSPRCGTCSRISGVAWFP